MLPIITTPRHVEVHMSKCTLVCSLSIQTCARDQTQLNCMRSAQAGSMWYSYRCLGRAACMLALLPSVGQAEQQALFSALY